MTQDTNNKTRDQEILNILDEIQKNVNNSLDSMEKRFEDHLEKYNRVSTDDVMNIIGGASLGSANIVVLCDRIKEMLDIPSDELKM